MQKIRIALADDHVLFRKGMAAILDLEEGFEVALEADNGLQLTQRIAGANADVVLMDMEMPEMDGLAATAKLKETHPDVRVLVISSHDEEEMIMAAVNAGARGYIIKDADPDEVVSAIHSVMENGFYFKENISRLLLQGIVEKDLLKTQFNPKELLTTREREVLQLVCEEFTNTEIGEKLFLSPRTIESYRKNMLEKIGARNTAGLVVFALKNNLVEL